MTLSVKYYVMFNIAWFFSVLLQLSSSVDVLYFEKYFLKAFTEFRTSATSTSHFIAVAAGPITSSNMYHLLLSYVFV